MADLILIDGDPVLFDPAFGPATVVVLPGTLKASGPTTKGGKKVAVDGDEKDVEVKGCIYMTPSFPVPGSGTLKIDRLGGDQKATKTKVGGKAVLLKGSKFVATFEVQSPAKLPAPPAPPTPDPMTQYKGTGSFMAVNRTLKGT